MLSDSEKVQIRQHVRELMEEDSPWVAGDGTHWLHFPVFGEWWGWTPGEDGLYCYPEQEFRAVYPDAPAG